MVEILLKQALEENEELKNKAQAIEKALDLLKQKRENARLELESIKFDCYDFEKYNLKLEAKIKLKTQIDTYTDCIATIEAELGRGK